MLSHLSNHQMRMRSANVRMCIVWLRVNVITFHWFPLPRHKWKRLTESVLRMRSWQSEWERERESSKIVKSSWYWWKSRHIRPYDTASTRQQCSVLKFSEQVFHASNYLSFFSSLLFQCLEFLLIDFVQTRFCVQETNFLRRKKFILCVRLPPEHPKLLN